jgi:hypothetical protein
MILTEMAMERAMSLREDVEVLKGLMRELLDLEASRQDSEEADAELLDMLARVAEVARAEAAERDDPELRELLEQVIELTEVH